MVRTKELGAAKPAAVAGGAVLLYTTPASKTAIIKDLRWRVIAATTMQVYIVRGATVYVIHEVITSGSAVVAGAVTFTVLEPGDTLWVTWSTTGQNSSLWVSGAELVGVA